MQIRILQIKPNSDKLRLLDRLVQYTGDTRPGLHSSIVEKDLPISREGDRLLSIEIGVPSSGSERKQTDQTDYGCAVAKSSQGFPFWANFEMRTKSIDCVITIAYSRQSTLSIAIEGVVSTALLNSW